MTRALFLLVLAVGVVGVAASANAAEKPDTLVTRTRSGAFAPGAAVSWAPHNNGVLFTLAAGRDPDAIAATLGERLARARVEIIGRQILVTGLPEKSLLAQLSELRLTGLGEDPLAALAGLGAGPSGADPEGGGSIRAGRAIDLPAQVIGDHDQGERVVAQVTAVERGQFPAVTLTLVVRSGAKAGPLRETLRRGATVAADVLFAGGPTGIDFAQASTQRNLAAYYLAKGDQVVVHAIASPDGRLTIDYVERRAR